MHKDPVKRKERLYSLIGLIVGIGLLVGGIIGVIASRIDANEYANTDDIRKVEAVIEEISSKDEKDDDNMITGTDYRTKLSFVVDGKTFYGNYDFYASARDYEKKAAYDQLKKGDTISVEIYKTSDGEYKLSSDNNPFIFLLYCAAIPVGAFVIYVFVRDLLGKKSKQENSNPTGKGKKSGTGKAGR